MTAFIYNASVLAGVALLATGAGLQWGLPAGLMAAGASVIGLTLAALRG